MPKLKTWIGASAADVGVRLIAQMASTIVLARLLLPEEFGLASLILGPAAVLAAFVGMPFEEALTQKANLTRRHLQTAFFASLALTLGLCVATVLAGPFLAALADQPGLTYWLPIATLFLFGQAAGAISRAVSRRRRRFVEIALYQSTSTVIGSALAVIIALSGFGVLALIIHRMMPIALYPVVASVLGGKGRGHTLIRPRWDRRHFQEISRFSRLHLVRVGIEYLNPTVLSFMVNAYFGTAILGQLNIAMRMTEPLRAGIASVGHNLVTSLLVSHRNDWRQLASSTLEVIANIASLAVPAFLGLAICAPVLLPLLVGPGWTEAVPLARALCLAAAISVPFRYVYSAFLAGGRPEFGVACAALGLVVMVISLLVLARIDGMQNVGLPVAIGEASVATFGFAILSILGGKRILGPTIKIARVWIAATAMVLVLTGIFLRGPFPDAGLAPLILVGATSYSVFLFIACRPCFDMLFQMFVPRRG